MISSFTSKWNSGQETYVQAGCGRREHSNCFIRDGFFASNHSSQ